MKNCKEEQVGLEHVVAILHGVASEGLSATVTSLRRDPVEAMWI